MYLAQIQVVTAGGKTVELTKVSENCYTFVQPRGAVTVSATFLPLSGGEERIFSDVESFAWYAEAVRFVVEQGIMQG
ncbi:MAG: S-layer homology domain-containing protein, partial [Flavonifractor plautii]